MTFDLTVLVGSCDKYSYLWSPFAFLFNTHWDQSIDVPKFILTETKSENLPGFQFICSEKDRPGPAPSQKNWSNAVLTALNQITTKYVLWMQDDYFLVRTLGKETFESYFYLMEHYKADKLAIHYPHTELKLTPLIPEFSIYTMDQDSPYTNTLQSAIWNVEFFKRCLLPNESPWEFELLGGVRTNANPHTILLHQIVPNWYYDVVQKGIRHEKYESILRAHNRPDLIRPL